MGRGEVCALRGGGARSGTVTSNEGGHRPRTSEWGEGVASRCKGGRERGLCKAERERGRGVQGLAFKAHCPEGGPEEGCRFDGGLRACLGSRLARHWSRVVCVYVCVL